MTATLSALELVVIIAVQAVMVLYTLPIPSPVDSGMDHLPTRTEATAAIHAVVHH